MFFILLGSIAIIAAILFTILCPETDFIGASIFIITLAMLPIIIPINCGVSEYPYIIGELEEVKALVNSTEDIKDTYILNIESGSFVGGSLDNMQQANKIYDYVSMCSKRKAIINARIVKTQARMQIPLYWWFQDTAFIDKRVMNLEKI